MSNAFRTHATPLRTSRFAPLCAVLLLMVCCQRSEQTSDDDHSSADALPGKMTLEAGQTVSFPLDDRTVNVTDCLLPYVQGDRRYLAYSNSALNAIDFYDFDTKELVQRTVVKVDGPERVGDLNGFLVVGLDSIWVLSRFSHFVYLLDATGSIKEKINYVQNAGGDELNSAGGTTTLNVPIILRDQALYLTQLPAGNWNILTQHDLDQQPVEIKVNLSDGSVHKLPMVYPNDYNAESGGANPTFSRTYGDNRFVYCFSGDGHLYATADHRRVDKHAADSRFYKKPSPLGTNPDMASYLKWVAETFLYESIYYDPYRKVYYRFAKLPQEVSTDDDAMQLAQKPREASVIILDAQLNKIGETRLPSGRHLISNAFVAEEGLYISNSHPDNPTMHDDTLAFTVFKLVANEQ